MPRPQKHLSEYTEWEQAIASRYINRQLRDFEYPSDEIHDDAAAAWDAAHGSIEREKWVETYLSPEQARRLFDAIRMARKRNKDRTVRDGTKTVTLAHYAWRILSTIAKENNVTMSQIIIERLEKEYLQSPDQ